MNAAASVHRMKARRGAITVFVFVCLVLIISIGAALLRIGLAERTLVRGEERKLQAEWLVESGLDRAAAKLSADSKYTGETWDPPAEALRGPYPARVTIAIEAVKDAPAKHQLRVSADYPRGGANRVRLSKQIIVERVSTPKG